MENFTSKNIKRNAKDRGDTIIEVLLAMVIISAVLASAYTLTNRSTQLNQTAVERTTVANLMREQVELIRGARTVANSQSQNAVWGEIINKVGSIGTNANYVSCSPSSGTNPFYLDINKDYSDASMVQTFTAGPPAIDAAPGDIFSIWAEGHRYNGGPKLDDYIDFHIRACWEGIGGATEQRSATVLRLAV